MPQRDYTLNIILLVTDFILDFLGANDYEYVMAFAEMIILWKNHRRFLFLFFFLVFIGSIYFLKVCFY